MAGNAGRTNSVSSHEMFLLQVSSALPQGHLCLLQLQLLDPLHKSCSCFSQLLLLDPLLT